MGGLHADAVPFPFGNEILRLDRRQAPCPRSDATASAAGTSLRHRRRAVALGLRARRTARYKAAQPVPDLLDIGERHPDHSASAVLASRAETPTRSAPVRSLSRAQRPVASSRSSQPARSAGTSVGRRRLQRLDDGREPRAARDRRGLPARSERWSRPCRRHSRATGRTAQDRRARQACSLRMRRSGSRKNSPSVSAASA